MRRRSCEVQAFALLGVFLGQVWTLGARLAAPRSATSRSRTGSRSPSSSCSALVLVARLRGRSAAPSPAVATEAPARRALLLALPAASGTDGGARFGFVWRPLVAGARRRSTCPAAGAARGSSRRSPRAVFLVVALAVGAIPPEVVPALRSRRRCGEAARRRCCAATTRTRGSSRPWELLRDEFDVGRARDGLEPLRPRGPRAAAVVRVTRAARPAPARAGRRACVPRLRATATATSSEHLRRRGHRPLGRARRLVQRPAGGAEGASSASGSC